MSFYIHKLPRFTAILRCNLILAEKYYFASYILIINHCTNYNSEKWFHVIITAFLNTYMTMNTLDMYKPTLSFIYLALNFYIEIFKVILLIKLVDFFFLAS